MNAGAAPHPVVLYDGVCGLCNRLVRIVLARDPAGVFRFAPLQGEFARGALARHARDREPMETMETMYVVLGPGTPEERLLSHSEAAVYVLGRIRGPLRAARALRLLPRFLRDPVYALVARSRYRWFGKFESCPLPRPEWRERFLG
jgi:predicted DCC family thiol-disulfide oxidoreductase YuxK